MKRACAIFVLLLFAGTSASAADNLTPMEWTVDRVAREALVYEPATAKINRSPFGLRLRRRWACDTLLPSDPS